MPLAVAADLAPTRGSLQRLLAWFVLINASHSKVSAHSHFLLNAGDDDHRQIRQSGPQIPGSYPSRRRCCVDHWRHCIRVRVFFALLVVSSQAPSYLLHSTFIAVYYVFHPRNPHTSVPVANSVRAWVEAYRTAILKGLLVLTAVPMAYLFRYWAF